MFDVVYKVLMRKLFFLSLILSACSNDNEGPNDQRITYSFQDGFETQNDDLADLFPSDGSRWSNVQLVNPTNGENKISLESSVLVEGNKALKIEAKASEAILSKADIEKGGFEAPENASVTIEANFYIDSDGDLENLLLIDLECCSCWDPPVPDNQCPGVRLMLKANDYLSIERGKISGSTFTQTQVPFPRREWVYVRWEMQLSPTDQGMNVLYINGAEAISQNGMNMPNADLFRSEAANQGINFELQEPVFYERLQVGATANPTDTNVLLYVDDVTLEIRE